MITVADLIIIARDYLGVPYRHQGRSRRGVDCLGCLALIARDASLPVALMDETAYGHVPDSAYLQSRLDDLLIRVAQNEIAEPGRIALLRFASICGGHHLALTTPVGILHAYAPARKVVETAMPAHWQSRITAIYRIPEVAY